MGRDQVRELNICHCTASLTSRVIRGSSIMIHNARIYGFDSKALLFPDTYENDRSGGKGGGSGDESLRGYMKSCDSLSWKSSSSFSSLPPLKKSPLQFVALMEASCACSWQVDQRSRRPVLSRPL